MVQIFYKDGTPVINPNKEGEQLEYHIDKKMLKFLEKVKYLINQHDKDFVLACGGYEGSGKSTLMQQIGRYVDPTLCLDRICMTADEFKTAIANASKGQCVIYDEAVTGMSAGDSITRIGKLLKSMMMQMRQKNLFVIIIIPSIFELNKYTVLSRIRAYIHTYENKGKMGYFSGFNKRDSRILYFKGKKNYSIKVRTRFRGRFYGKYAVEEQAYRKKKADALFKLDDEDVKTYESDKLNYTLYVLKEETGKTLVEIEQLLRKQGISLDSTAIGKRIQKVKWKLGEKERKDMENALSQTPIYN